MIVFASFINTSDKDFSQTFFEWIKVCHRLSLTKSIFWRHKGTNRNWKVCPHQISELVVISEVLSSSPSQVRFLRKTSGSKLNVFAPVNDLSSLSKSSFETRSLVAGKQSDMAIASGHILGDEYTNHVIKVSSTNFTPLLPLDLVSSEPLWCHSPRKVGSWFLHANHKWRGCL